MKQHNRLIGATFQGTADRIDTDRWLPVTCVDRPADRHHTQRRRQSVHPSIRGTEWRAKTGRRRPTRIQNDFAGVAQLGDHSIVADLRQFRMIDGVIADRMTGVNNLCDFFRLAADTLPGDKKRRGSVVFRQYTKQLIGHEIGRRAVIERQVNHGAGVKIRINRRWC